MSATIVGGKTCAPSASFTRPADTTAYADGDLVANNTTAGSVAAMEFTNFIDPQQRSGCVRRARVHKSTTTTTAADFRLHLFTASPGVANGDNGAFVPSVVTGWLGSIAVSVDEAGTAGSVGVGVPVTGAEINFTLAHPQTNVTLYGLLEAKAAYAPGNAEVFTVTLEAYAD
jgi:hypothetical protein